MTTNEPGAKKEPNEADLELVRIAAQAFLTEQAVSKKVKDLVGKSTRLTLNIDDLRRRNGNLADFIVRNPLQAIQIFEELLNA